MMNKFIPGQEIETTIVAISGDCIFLDMNSKSEGILDKAEVTDENGNCSLNEGDKIKVFYLGEKNGEMRFTTKIAGQNADTSMIENAFKNGIPVEGKVEKEIKGIQIEKEEEKQSLLQMTLYYIEKALKTLPKKSY